MNSLFRQMSQQQGNPSLLNMINSMKNSGNPQQLLYQMARQNPQIQSVLNLIQQSGKTPKDLFYETAEKRGINPDDVLKQLTT